MSACKNQMPGIHPKDYSQYPVQYLHGQPLLLYILVGGESKFCSVCFFCIKWRIGSCVCSYAGCPRRNVPNFGRVFLMLKYIDITQNTYIQS
jgi:hypothetical protein